MVQRVTCIIGVAKQSLFSQSLGEQCHSKLPSPLLLNEHIIQINDAERAHRSLSAFSSPWERMTAISLHTSAIDVLLLVPHCDAIAPAVERRKGIGLHLRLALFRTRGDAEHVASRPTHVLVHMYRLAVAVRLRVNQESTISVHNRECVGLSVGWDPG